MSQHGNIFIKHKASLTNISCIWRHQWYSIQDHTYQLHEIGELANAFWKCVEFIIAGVEHSQRKTTHTCWQHWQLVPATAPQHSNKTHYRIFLNATPQAEMFIWKTSFWLINDNVFIKVGGKMLESKYNLNLEIKETLKETLKMLSEYKDIVNTRE